MNFLLLPIQLLLSFFLLFAVSRVYLRFKEGTIKLGAFLFWIGIWILTFFSIYNPAFITYLAQFLGVGRGADVLIYFSIVLLFYLVFRTNVMVENLHEEITKLVREIALKRQKEKGTKSRTNTKQESKRNNSIY